MALRRLALLLLVCVSLSGLTLVNAQDERLKVVATYSILGDIVQNVAGDTIDLTVLVGPDGDSHAYEPTPQDAIALAEADIIFENGFEFETWLDDLYTSSGSTATRIVVSDGIEPLAFVEGEHVHEHEEEHDDEHAEAAALITDLSTWSGEWLSIWALGEETLQPATDAILASTPELTLENVMTYLEEGNATTFDTFKVEGEAVTYTSEAGSVICNYVFTGRSSVMEFPTSTWSLFATSDADCADYRYLLLMPPHAAEAGSTSHFHMRHGSTSFTQIIADTAPWYPSLYPIDTDPAVILNSWVVNARMIGLYIATAYDIEVTLTEDEQAAADPATPSEGLTPQRLLVSDGAEGKVSVVNLATGEVLATYDLSAPATVYTSPSGRYGFAVQSDGNIVNVIDSGIELESHEDHFHKHVEEPALLDYAFEGPTPIHFVMHGDQIVVFTDDNGTASLLTEANLTDADAPVLTFVSDAPHHGVGVALDDVVLLSHFEGAEGEDLPNGIDVLDLDGHILQSFGECSELHGEAVLDDGAAFACAEGVMVIEHDSDAWTARTISYPSDGRAWTLVHDARSPYLFGDYGETAIVQVDVEANTAEAIEFEQPVWEFKFHPDDASKLLVLTVDGHLHVVDAASGAIDGSVAVVETFTVPEEWGDPRPSFTTIPGHALVSDPIQGVVNVIHLDGLEVEEAYEVGGTPVGLTAFGLAPIEEEAHDHDEEGHAHEHGEHDPHIWHDPNNGVVMVENIRAALVAADPGNAEAYNANAEAYTTELTALDAYTREQVASIPEERRILVTSHDTFGYFADEYGFVVSSALGSFSTETADPGAGEIAELVTEIQASGVPAIFAENVTNPDLIQMIANEAGVAVAPTLYTDALGQPGTSGETYLGLLRYNTDTVTEALK